MPTIKHTEWYYSGNPDHADKQRVYVADTREMLKLLMLHKIHCFTIDQRVEWLGDATIAGEPRLKLLCDKKQVYADNHGLYRLA
jgi:hypothetical protein